jgi:hypothetical protein
VASFISIAIVGFPRQHRLLCACLSSAYVAESLVFSRLAEHSLSGIMLALWTDFSTLCQPAILSYLLASPVYLRSGIIDVIKHDHSLLAPVDGQLDAYTEMTNYLLPFLYLVSTFVNRTNNVFHRAEHMLLFKTYTRILNLCHDMRTLKVVTAEGNSIGWYTSFQVGRLDIIATAVNMIKRRLIEDWEKTAHPDPTSELGSSFQQGYIKSSTPLLLKAH